MMSWLRERRNLARSDRGRGSRPRRWTDCRELREIIRRTLAARDRIAESSTDIPDQFLISLKERQLVAIRRSEVVDR